MRRLVALAVVAAAALPLALSAGAGRAVARFDFFQLDLSSGASHALGAGLVDDLSPDRSSVLYRFGGRLIVARIDGSDAHTLADLPHQILAATWSPDGRAIAFELADTTACRSVPPPCGDFQVWLVGRDGSALHRLADNAAEPAWSPDSRRLAFLADYDTPSLSGVVSVENVDGSGLRALTAREGAANPRWSRDGRFVAYTRVVRRGSRDVVRVLDVRRPGRGRTIARGETPIWLASGRLAFVRHLSPTRDGLFVTGGGERRVRRLAVEDAMVGPTASPGGRRIAYSVGATVVVAAAVGPRARERFPVPATADPQTHVFVRSIWWSRNGRSLLYVRMLFGVPGP